MLLAHTSEDPSAPGFWHVCLPSHSLLCKLLAHLSACCLGSSLTRVLPAPPDSSGPMQAQSLLCVFLHPLSLENSPPFLLPFFPCLRSSSLHLSFSLHSPSPHPRLACLIAYLDFYNSCLIGLPVSIFPAYHFKTNLPKSHILSGCSQVKTSHHFPINHSKYSLPDPLCLSPFPSPQGVLPLAALGTCSSHSLAFASVGSSASGAPQSAGPLILSLWKPSLAPLSPALLAMATWVGMIWSSVFYFTAFSLCTRPFHCLPEVLFSQLHYNPVGGQERRAHIFPFFFPELLFTQWGYFSVRHPICFSGTCLSIPIFSFLFFKNCGKIQIT